MKTAVRAIVCVPIVATEKTIVCADTTSIADYNIPSISTVDVVLQLLPNYLFHYWSSYFQLAGFVFQLLTPAKLTMADANISAQQQAPGVYAAAGLVTIWPTMAPVVLVRRYYTHYCSNLSLRIIFFSYHLPMTYLPFPRLTIFDCKHIPSVPVN